MTASTIQGRYYLLSAPVASPGQCGICGYGGTERTYLDPRLDFEFYGSLIFCETCIMPMAELFGYIDPAKARLLEARVEEAERELVIHRASLLQLEGLHDALIALGVPMPAASAVSVSAPVSVVDNEPAVSVDAEEGGRVSSGEPAPDESSSVEGPNDLFGLTEPKRTSNSK